MCARLTLWQALGRADTVQPIGKITHTHTHTHTRRSLLSALWLTVYGSTGPLRAGFHRLEEKTTCGLTSKCSVWQWAGLSSLCGLRHRGNGGGWLGDVTTCHLSLHTNTHTRADAHMRIFCHTSALSNHLLYCFLGSFDVDNKWQCTMQLLHGNTVSL